MTMYS